MWPATGTAAAPRSTPTPCRPCCTRSATPSGSAISGRFFLEAGASLDAGSGTYSLSALDVTPPPILFFSLQTPVTTAAPSVLGGLSVRANDIVAFDGTRFRTWLNGNESGLAGALLRDFHIVNNNDVVVAFQNPVTLAGIAFDDSDLARLTRGPGGW